MERGAIERFPAAVDGFGELAELEGPLHLAIGVFDGVHLGHRAVIEPAVSSARRSGGRSGVLTFHPHPSRLFRPDDPTLLIMDIGTKTRVLHEMGVDLVIRKGFDREFAAIPAEEFLRHLKDAIPALAAVHVGANFRFGRKRAGDVDTLLETGRELGISVFSVDRLHYNGAPISSTRIRNLLTEGDIVAANRLLGYHYRASGRIIGGRRLGRTIGFPTLNLPWAPECRPRHGVYRVRFRGASGEPWRDGVANYGVRPTVEGGDEAPLLEVHAFSGPGLDEGDDMDVEWLDFIRPERKFDGMDALKAQIARDCEAAREMAENGRGGD